MLIKKYYLIFAFVCITIIALLYGIAPQWFARVFLNEPILNPNVAHILRAVMGLYLALGLFWLYAAFNDLYRNTAVLTLLIFCTGLVSGRFISVLVDGQPASLLSLYIVLELIFVPLSYWVFKLPE